MRDNSIMHLNVQSKYGTSANESKSRSVGCLAKLNELYLYATNLTE
jgi:hypothetical protein